MEKKVEALAKRYGVKPELVFRKLKELNEKVRLLPVFKNGELQVAFVKDLGYRRQIEKIVEMYALTEEQRAEVLALLVKH
jgi:hypothetical protein